MLKKIESVFTKCVEWLLGIIAIAMIVLVIAQVWFRYVSKLNLSWSDEISRYLLVFMAFLAVVVLFSEHGHVYITNLVDARFLPKAVKNIMKLLTYLAELFFFCVLVYGGFTYLPIAATMSTPAVQIPMNYLYAIVPITSIFMVIFCIRDLVVLLKGWAER